MLYRSACVAEIRHVQSQAVFDSRGVGNVADAESEGVRSARRPLLGGAAVLLRRGGCRAKQDCQRVDRTFKIMSGHSSDWSLRKKAGFSSTRRAHEKLNGSLERISLTGPLVHGLYKLYGLV